MTQTLASTRRSWVISLVVVAVAVRVTLGVLTWEPGWSALTWDDFTRVTIAQQWAAAPYLVNDLVWLPLPVWITGSVYALAGQWFEASPMALMAILNTFAIFVAASVSAWTAHRMFSDTIGSATVFVVALFAPWGYFLSLSGLAEPLYFVAITVATAGLVSWGMSGRDGSLAVGSAGVAAAAAMRYEGWWLAAAWVLVIGVDTLLMLRTRPVAEVVTKRLRTMAVAAAPLGVPVAWMAINFAREGSPLYFARESARIFRIAYGSFERVVDRVFYYPVALVRSAPFLLVAIALSAFVKRHRRSVVLVVALFSSQFVLFYVASSASGAIGAFPERFLFAYALGLAPLLGGLPGAISDSVPARLIRPVAAVFIAAALIVTVVRLQDRPEEWTHAPDLLALNEYMGDAALSDTIVVITGQGMGSDLVPINIQNGYRVGVEVAGNGFADSWSDASLWVERNPERIVDFGIEGARTVGRFRVSGPFSDELLLPTCLGCDGWMWVDESGVERPMRGGPYVGFEFVTDDPTPGQRTGAIKAISQAPHPQRGSVDLRWLYGHGFNLGRMNVAVTLDDVAIFEADVGDPSRWTRVEFDIPPGDGTSVLRVEVVALPGIESGWAWGRASSVLIRELTVEPL